MAQVAEKLQPWLAALDERPRGGSRWLQDLRDHAASRFVELGFPSVRDEEWRFTNISPIASTEFRLAPPSKLDAAVLDTFLYADAPFRLVVLNGRVVPELSRTAGLPTGLKFGSLATAATDQADIVARYLGQLADPSTRTFAALNTAFTHDGAYVYVPDGLVFEQPLQILFVSTSEAPVASMSHPRTLIVAGDRSQLQIVETYVSAPGQKHFTNAVTEIVAGEGAVLDHYKVEEESVDAFHMASTHIHAVRNSNVSTHAFTLGGRIVRNDIIAVLDGEGAECTLNGLYLADGDRLVDTHTTIDHAKAHCPSHEIYKGILGGRARAVFNGKIIVRIDAQKTDAKQTNRALLLSDNASINTKPQLEIFADDVKCTHGAAIGQLDDDAIFYLRARGLTYLEARDMLIHAFAGEILERVKIEPLRRALESELYTQLAKDLAEVDAA
jgi:Fe-S cluster assembly protein SufD